MSERTTIILGSAGRRAAQRLAKRWGVTPSEAIRRALLKVAAEESTVARERQRRRRVVALDALIEMSTGGDLEAELQRIQEERDAW